MKPEKMIEGTVGAGLQAAWPKDEPGREREDSREEGPGRERKDRREEEPGRERKDRREEEPGRVREGVLEPVLTGERLSVTYGSGEAAVRALRGVSLEIRPGEFIVVLGPSGSGKSTLLNLLGGMERPGEGRLFYRGDEVTRYSDRRMAAYRRDVVGFVFQFFNLIPSLTALENVALAASLAKDPFPAGEAMRLVGLSGKEERFPSQLSGGEQQRVSIARALVKRPKLLLCDEPTGALDSVNSIAVVKLLLDMRDTFGCPVVTITHNAQMGRVADRIFHMKDGMLGPVEVNSSPCKAEELIW